MAKIPNQVLWFQIKSILFPQYCLSLTILCNRLGTLSRKVISHVNKHWIWIRKARFKFWFCFLLPLWLEACHTLFDTSTSHSSVKWGYWLKSKVFKLQHRHHPLLGFSKVHQALRMLFTFFRYNKTWGQIRWSPPYISIKSCLLSLNLLAEWSMIHWL